MIIIRILASLVGPSAALILLLGFAKTIGKVSPVARNVIEGVFGALLFWPLAVYEKIVKEPKESWEGFWNESMTPCAIGVMIIYSLVLFVLLGRISIFHETNKDCPEKTGTCSTCGKSFCGETHCPDCQAELEP